jgi:hypothetical protein
MLIIIILKTLKIYEVIKLKDKINYYYINRKIH